MLDGKLHGNNVLCYRFSFLNRMYFPADAAMFICDIEMLPYIKAVKEICGVHKDCVRVITPIFVFLFNDVVLLCLQT